MKLWEGVTKCFWPILARFLYFVKVIFYTLKESGVGILEILGVGVGILGMTGVGVGPFTLRLRNPA